MDDRRLVPMADPMADPTADLTADLTADRRLAPDPSPWMHIGPLAGGAHRVSCWGWGAGSFARVWTLDFWAGPLAGGAYPGLSPRLRAEIENDD
ncbi:MAG: hypothetical protein ACI4TJ_00155 [Candidatus Cryptobacteroides sp.]